MVGVFVVCVVISVGVFVECGIVVAGVFVVTCGVVVVGVFVVTCGIVIVGVFVVTCGVVVVGVFVVARDAVVVELLVVFVVCTSCPRPQHVISPSLFFPMHTHIVRETFPFKFVALHVYNPLCPWWTLVMFKKADVR